MSPDFEGTLSLVAIVATLPIGGVIVADALGVASLSNAHVQVLLAALLLPWLGINARRRDWRMVGGLGLIAGGNLAFLGNALLGLLGVLAILAGAILVVTRSRRVT